MPSPKEVFDNRKMYWGFVTAKSDEDFEGSKLERPELSSEHYGEMWRNTLGASRRNP